MDARNSSTKRLFLSLTRKKSSVTNLFIFLLLLSQANAHQTKETNAAAESALDILILIPVVLILGFSEFFLKYGFSYGPSNLYASLIEELAPYCHTRFTDALENYTGDIPDELTCPISHSIMNVVAQINDDDKHFYDLAWLLKYLTDNPKGVFCFFKPDVLITKIFINTKETIEMQNKIAKFVSEKAEMNHKLLSQQESPRMRTAK